MQTQMVNHIQGFESNPEIFNLTTGMEMIGHSKNLEQQQGDTNMATWFNKHGNNPSSSKEIMSQPPISINISSTSRSSQLGYLKIRPSQGLSLSLSSSNSTGIGLQSFELRQTSHGNYDEADDMRFIGSSSRDGFFEKTGNLHHRGQFQLRSSKYLDPAKDLLNEFCSLGIKQFDASKQKQTQNTKQWDNDDDEASSSRKQSLYSLDFSELQRRKTKLLSMLEEVDRRYKVYCSQMKTVVSSFEAVAGTGAASVYSALASKAMSRHFRCLRDGIVSQIQATRKAMGEKDPVASVTTKGETPRLRVLDQALRQQRAFQQMSMESHPWRPQRGLPERSVSVLRAWLFEHFLHPTASLVSIISLGIQLVHQCSVRLWKPMVEEMYLEETKEHDNFSDNGVHYGDDNDKGNGRLNISVADQKPIPDQLIRVDSECLSSIITNADKNEPKSAKTLETSTSISSSSNSKFWNLWYHGVDFASYGHYTAGGVPFHNANKVSTAEEAEEMCR
ncbi:BEL1-like homeodomain protein 4 [Hibiscus syriacus]|uniref:BEL1-like homeodomain protein 4 n=1 Tax=Hibiscus syriacus TaxID=106335 RepID=A0A6A3BB70_HIBSY|nr:BEL1-like homeodomain protein 4 [Hibiscus syriacus]